MRFAMMAAVALAGMTALPALAEVQVTNPDARQVRETGNRKTIRPGTIVAVSSQVTIASGLPLPRIGDKAQTSDYLKCAYAALAVGREGLARQSLEMAETRALGGPMLKGVSTVPGDMPKIARIRDALRALGAGDRGQAIQFVKIAMLN
jgi:hypothetical protein